MKIYEVKKDNILINLELATSIQIIEGDWANSAYIKVCFSSNEDCFHIYSPYDDCTNPNQLKWLKKIYNEIKEAMTCKDR